MVHVVDESKQIWPFSYPSVETRMIYLIVNQMKYQSYRVNISIIHMNKIIPSSNVFPTRALKADMLMIDDSKATS